MKLKESGMPGGEDAWEKFFSPEKILKTLEVDNKVRDIADFGSGYGTFTIPAAKIVKGKVYAIDIDSELIETTKKRIDEEGLNNVETMLRDFIINGSGLKKESVDYAFLFNMLYVNGNPDKLLKEAYRILKPNGKVGIIHWNYDPTTPRGPSMEIRPKPEQIIKWAKNAGFNSPEQHDLKPHHYGIVMEKRK